MHVLCCVCFSECQWWSSTATEMTIIRSSCEWVTECFPADLPLYRWVECLWAADLMPKPDLKGPATNHNTVQSTAKIIKYFPLTCVSSWFSLISITRFCRFALHAAFYLFIYLSEKIVKIQHENKWYYGEVGIINVNTQKNTIKEHQSFYSNIPNIWSVVVILQLPR